MTVFFVAHHGFQRTEHTEFGFDCYTDRMGELNDFFRHSDVVLITGNRLTALPVKEPSIITEVKASSIAAIQTAGD